MAYADLDSRLHAFSNRSADENMLMENYEE
jgi:hypothetical protein